MKKVAILAAVGATLALAGCKDQDLVRFFGTSDRCQIASIANNMALQGIDAAKIRVSAANMKKYNAAYKGVKAACAAGSDLKSIPNAAQLFSTFMAAAGELRS